MIRVLVFEDNPKMEREIRKALTSDKRVYSVRVARTIHTTLDALLVGADCRYDLLVSRSTVLVRKLAEHRSGRFDLLSKAANAGKVRRGGIKALLESVNWLMAMRGL